MMTGLWERCVEERAVALADLGPGMLLALVPSIRCTML